jgi:FkbM family methyltransferase
MQRLSKWCRDFIFRLLYGFRGIPVEIQGHRLRFDESLRRWDPRTEHEVQVALCKHLRPGDVVVDVGANYGLHTLLAARCVGETGKVYAFEPIPANCSLLEHHGRLNACEERILLIRQAASDTSEGTIELYGAAQGLAFSASLGQKDSIQPSLTVPVTTLDACLAGRAGAIRLIKIDVEGAEGLVLRGAREILVRDRPILIVEVHSFALPKFGSSAAAFRREVESFGYREEVIDRVSGTEGDYYHAVYSPVSIG